MCYKAGAGLVHGRAASIADHEADLKKPALCQMKKAGPLLYDQLPHPCLSLLSTPMSVHVINTHAVHFANTYLPDKRHEEVSDASSHVTPTSSNCVG
jgi:hypothetical protein